MILKLLLISLLTIIIDQTDSTRVARKVDYNNIIEKSDSTSINYDQMSHKLDSLMNVKKK